MEDGLLSIGQLAKRTGLPVKTIRYYDEIGLLRPSARTGARYRRYSRADRNKLALIRSLRALGFSLEAIAAMAGRTRDVKALIALQLDLVETQLRALERQRAVLRAVPSFETPATRAPQDDMYFTKQLELANAATLLGATEREAKLEAYLERTSTGASPSERARFRRMVVEDLPAELDGEQLEAWIRLSALLDDDGLIETLRRQHEPFASARVSPRRRERFAGEFMEILGEAVAAMQDGAQPTDERVQRLAGRWTKLFARALGKRHDRRFLRWFLAYAEATNDPRIEQFWRDLARLRGWSGVPPFHRAQALLCEGLRSLR